MIPFKDTYYNNKLSEFRNKSKIQSSLSVDDVTIEYKNIFNGRINAYMHTYRGDFYHYPILKQGENTLMALTPLEIGSTYEVIRRAKGKVGIVGLGLGYYLQEILEKDKVKEIVVYEINNAVIEIYYKNFGYHPKLKIVNTNAFDIKDKKFDFFYVDIYNYKLSEKVVEDYIIFNKNLYIGEYVFWGIEHFILSLDNEDLKKAKLPEHWLAMADNIGDRFYQSKYKENLISINYSTCIKILKNFIEIFGEKN